MRPGDSMNKIHTPTLEFLSYYADTLNSVEVKDILNKKRINTEHEAKSLLKFLDEMCVQVAKDTNAGVVVLRQKVATYDAEKVCSVIEDYLEDIGYGYLTEEGLEELEELAVF